MKPLPNIDPDSQLARFRAAVQLLGGVRSAARELGCNDRTIYALVYGDRELHDGWLRDMAAALVRHADQCRALERQISPAFAANLTEAQQTKPAHGNRFDRKDRHELDAASYLTGPGDRRAAPQGRPDAPAENKNG